jgi:hypothetical protein
MADVDEAEAPARGKRSRTKGGDAPEAAPAAGTGDNGGESGDGPAADPVDNGGEEVTGDGTGESLPVIDQLEAAADAIEFNTQSLVFDLRDGIIEFLKRMPKPWGITPFDQQQDIAAAAEHVAKEMVRRAVEAMASDGRTSIRALLESYTEKDGIKVTLKVKTFSEDEALAAVIGLHKAQGKHVLITVASADDYAEDRRDPPTMPDQPGLGFEAGTDDHPEDDSDLAGDDTETNLNVLLGIPDGVTCRLNLTSGMFEKLTEGGDPDDEKAWQDVRAATPDELAAERNRLADFE